MSDHEKKRAKLIDQEQIALIHYYLAEKALEIAPTLALACELSDARQKLERAEAARREFEEIHRT